MTSPSCPPNLSRGGFSLYDLLLLFNATLNKAFVREYLGDAIFLCDKAATLRDTIKGTNNTALETLL
jgi:hypothetical protein